MKPIRTTIIVEPHVTPGKVYGRLKFNKLFSNKIRYTLHFENPRILFLKTANFFIFGFTMYTKEKILTFEI